VVAQEAGWGDVERIRPVVVRDDANANTLDSDRRSDHGLPAPAGDLTLNQSDLVTLRASYRGQWSQWDKEQSRYEDDETA